LNHDTVGSLFDSYIYFKETLNIQRTWFLPVCEEAWEDGDPALYYREMGKIYDYIMHKTKQTKDLYEIKMNAPMDRALMSTGKRLPCGAGRGYGTITANGELYPCHHFYFNDPDKETLMGNLWDGISEEKRRLFTSYDEDDMSCGDCEHGACYRCIAVNLIHNGSIFSQTRGKYCQMMKIDFHYQEKIREELRKMGLLNGTNSNNQELTAEQAGFDCKKVYKDFGSCYIVDITKQEENKQNNQVRDTIENQDTGDSLIETWSSDTMKYEKIRNKDGSISVYSMPIMQVKTGIDNYESFIKEDGCSDEKCSSGKCASGNCGSKKEKEKEVESPKELSDDFQEIVTEALSVLLRKVDVLEKIILQKK
jgi:radical SAM protein with 4Fe4S-binding SPASM domain